MFSLIVYYIYMYRYIYNLNCGKRCHGMNHSYEINVARTLFAFSICEAFITEFVRHLLRPL